MKEIHKAYMLQQQYRNNQLSVSNMTESEYKAIEKMYNVQINYMENEIKKCQSKKD